MNQKYSILIIVLLVFFCLSINLQAVEFYSKKGKLSFNLGGNWVRTSKNRLNVVNETFRKNNVNIKFVDGFYDKLNKDVYIWIQVIKGDYEPNELLKAVNLDITKTEIEDYLSKKSKNIDKRVSSQEIGSTIWSDEHKAAIMKVLTKRDNTPDLNALSYFFFLENQITGIHCNYPSNFDQSTYYNDAMNTIVIDDNYAKDDNWYKILYGLLGLKYLR